MLEWDARMRTWAKIQQSGDYFRKHQSMQFVISHLTFHGEEGPPQRGFHWRTVMCLGGFSTLAKTNKSGTK